MAAPSERHPVTALLADLVRIESINPAHDPAGSGEAKVADHVEAWARARGIAVRRQPVLPGRENVLLTVGGARPGRRLLLEAHMDTVTVSGMTIPPFDPAIRDGRLYGRGACDVKAGLAAMMVALEEAHCRRDRLAGSVMLAAAVDEEFGFQGALALGREITADGCIVAEPTGLDVVIAHRGAVRFQVKAVGRAAHSSKPELGRNAITAMARVVTHLDGVLAARCARTRHPLCGPPSAIISLIRGGVQVNWVPPEAVIDIEARPLPGEESADWVDLVRDELPRVPGIHPDIRLECLAPYLDSPSLECPPDAAIAVSALRAAGRTVPAGAPYGTDASKLHRAGIPSVVLGPGSIDQAHGAVEWVDLDQVVEAVAIYGRAIDGFLG